MQWRFLPIALCKRIAATDESTPPESPRITLSPPIFSLSSVIVESIKESGVQVCSKELIFVRKFSKIFFPSTVW